MTQLQINKLDAFERVVKNFGQNPAVVALNATFQADAKTLETKVVSLRSLITRVSATNAFAETKQSIKSNMLEFAQDICLIMTAYGVQVGNAEAIKVSKFTKSTLSKGTGEEIYQRCVGIGEKTRELVAELKDKRGMPESLLKQFEGSVAQFKDIKSEPQGAIQERKISNTELEKLFGEADVAMTMLVSSSIYLKGIADEFLSRFHNDRTIAAVQGSTTKANIDVQHGITGEKIFNFRVDSTHLNLSHKSTSVKDKTVTTNYHKAAELAISSEGFHTAYVTERLKKGQINKIIVKLIPITEPAPPPPTV